MGPYYAILGLLVLAMVIAIQLNHLDQRVSAIEEEKQKEPKK